METLSYENAIESAPIEPPDTLVSLLNEVMFRIPGCADVTARLMLQSAYREFCRNTSVLRRRYAIPVHAHGRICHIPMEAYLSVLRVEGAAMLRRGLPPVRLVEGVDYRVKPGTPPAITLEVDTWGEGVVEAVVVCAPVRGSEDVPPGFLDKHGDAIVHGALFRLYSMNGRPWSDQQQAQLEGREFMHMMNEAALNESGGNVDATNENRWA